mmetsp:Transcript_83887/g.234122  ORF Transcript_83887/g.234122 Transcript_83887/m.234122 type:complete len:1307 (-) Transcript_83887:113-4033(-)
MRAEMPEVSPTVSFDVVPCESDFNSPRDVGYEDSAPLARGRSGSSHLRTRLTLSRSKSSSCLELRENTPNRTQRRSCTSKTGVSVEISSLLSAKFAKVVEEAPNVLRKYAVVVATCPWVFFFSYLLGVILLVALAWRPFDFDPDFSSFVRADGEAMRNHEAMLEALTKKRDLEDSRRLQDVSTARPFYSTKVLTLVYEAVGGNALSERVLRDVRNFEKRLMNLPEWKRLCQDRVTLVPRRWLCDPGESFAALVWPTQFVANASGDRFDVRFDGHGIEPLPLPAVFAHMQHATVRDPSREYWRFFPRGFTPPDIGGSMAATMASPPAAIRSRITFLVTYGREDWSLSEKLKGRAKATKEYIDFVEGALYPLLQAASEDYTHIRVYYSGNDITRYDLERALQGDLLWAIGSIIFVTLYMWWHIRSTIISVGCFCIIFASVPMAYVLTPVEKTTVASFLSLFLITVIDIDVIFVFIDFWDQSARLKEVHKRLVWMILHAGRSCLATSATTSLSFFANLASALQPLREFGLFMGLSVMSVYVLALLFLPPLVVLRERQKERLRHLKSDSERTEFDSFSVVATVTPNGDLSAGGCSSERKETRLYMALFRLVDCISRCPIMVVLVFASCLPLFIVFIVAGFQLDQGIPEIFPAWHNQVAGKKLEDQFSTASAMHTIEPDNGGAVCGVDHNPRKGTASPCVLRWCNLNSSLASQGNASTGSCWRKQTMLANSDVGWGFEVCNRVHVANIFAASTQSFAETWPGTWSTVLYSTLGGDHGNSLPIQVSELEPLVLEDWERGAVETSRFFTTHTVEVKEPAGSGVKLWRRNALCNVETICFLGVRTCELPGYRPMAEFPLLSRRLMAEFPVTSHEEVTLPRNEPAKALGPPHPRGLQSLPRSSWVGITIVWGLRPARTTPLVGPSSEETWAFDPTFEPDNPFAQRSMYAMCTGLPEDLQLAEETCWIRDFRDWLNSSDRKFPSRDFDRDLEGWYRANAIFAQKHLWMLGRRMKACKLEFLAHFSKHASAQKMLLYKSRWDRYVSERNAAASTTANRAWHTTDAWVKAEAQIAIVSSTLDTIIIECACGWVGIAIFTGDLYIACLVFFLVIVNISGLVFFMVSVMRWAVGPIEIIFLVVFLGYSVTFGLHMAVNYTEVMPGNPELLHALKLQKKRAMERARRVRDKGDSGATLERDEIHDGDEVLTAPALRQARTRVAVLHVGGAILSSTISTVGSSVFLLVCTLSIFVKLGFVILVVVGLSFMVTLVALPAVLMLLGPAPEPCYKRWHRYMFSSRKNDDRDDEPLVKGMVVDEPE